MNYHTHQTFYDQSQHTGVGIFNKPYDQLIVLQYDNEHGLQVVQDISPYVDSEQARALYRPEVHLDTTASLPLRAHTLLGLAP